MKLLDNWKEYKQRLATPWRYLLEIVEFVSVLLVLLIVIRQGVFERRFIPSESMFPGLQIGDQLIIEKVSMNLRILGLGPKDFTRGDVIVFYPPPQANGGKDLKDDPISVFVRLTGLSDDIKIGQFSPFFFLPKAEDAYIKRIIGLPGDEISIKLGKGVFVNGKLLLEPYVADVPRPPSYTADINSMEDIIGIDIKKYGTGTLKVPPGHYFCLGDNRNNSNDSHVWGFVPRERVIGRAFSLIWRDLGLQRPIFAEDLPTVLFN